MPRRRPKRKLRPRKMLATEEIPEGSITVKEIADMAGVTTATVCTWLRQDAFESAVKVRGDWYVLKSEVEEQLVEA